MVTADELRIEARRLFPHSGAAAETIRLFNLAADTIEDLMRVAELLVEASNPIEELEAHEWATLRIVLVNRAIAIAKTLVEDK